MSSFRTVELSDPRFEQTGLRFVTFKSPALNGRGDFSLFLPPSHEKSHSLPLVILLHGVYGSHWAWPFKAGAHNTALRLLDEKIIAPMVLAMPSDGLWGDGSGYLPHQSKNYEKWIVDDTINCVQEVCACVDKDSPLFIAGLSMGGYGALRIGAKYHNRFKGISAHSSITNFDQLALFVEEPLSEYQQTNQEESSVLYWILKNKAVLPALRFDCGETDRLIEHNRQLHAALDKHQVKHIYEEFPGGHEWSYWEDHLKDSLKFFNSLL